MRGSVWKSILPGFNTSQNFSNTEEKCIDIVFLMYDENRLFLRYDNTRQREQSMRKAKRLQAVAKHLHDLRQSRNMTQSEMGRALNIASTTVSGYENGHILPNIDVLIDYADYFGVDYNYLFNMDKDSPNEIPYISHTESVLLYNYKNCPVDVQEIIRRSASIGSQCASARIHAETAEQPMMISEKKGKYRK